MTPRIPFWDRNFKGIIMYNFRINFIGILVYSKRFDIPKINMVLLLEERYWYILYKLLDIIGDKTLYKEGWAAGGRMNIRINRSQTPSISNKMRHSEFDFIGSSAPSYKIPAEQLAGGWYTSEPSSRHGGWLTRIIWSSPMSAATAEGILLTTRCRRRVPFSAFPSEKMIRYHFIYRTEKLFLDIFSRSEREECIDGRDHHGWCGLSQRGRREDTIR